MKLTVLAVLALVAAAAAKVPTCEDEAKMKADIRAMFAETNFHPGALRLGKFIRVTRDSCCDF
jgi:hypothetical protein